MMKQFTADDIVWENVPCNFCHSDNDSPLFSGPDRLAGLPGQFTMVQCANCGLIRQNPRPVWDSLQYYYQEDYVSHVPIIDDEPSIIRRWDRRWGMYKLLNAVQEKQPKGRLLDIGAGTGVFLAEAIRRGNWSVVGLEPSRHAAEYARQRLDATIYNDSFPSDALTELAGQFDLITMWHVAEHLADPLGSFEQIHNLLKPEGWFIFTIPNYESWDLRVFGDYWVGWDLPRHLFVFPKNSLTKMLAQCGLYVRERRCIATSYTLIGHNFTFWTQDWAKKHAVWAKLLLKLYHNNLSRILLTPFLWVMGKRLSAPAVTVFAQKER
jgi:2-polyprenyl-3-methyl-5-hydroxy-6-metoxy-1,4-benzoquinol methylase